MPPLSKAEIDNLVAKVSKRDQILADKLMEAVEKAVKDKVVRVRTPKDVQSMIKACRDLRGFAERHELKVSGGITHDLDARLANALELRKSNGKPKPKRGKK